MPFAYSFPFDFEGMSRTLKLWFARATSDPDSNLTITINNNLSTTVSYRKDLATIITFGGG